MRNISIGDFKTKNNINCIECRGKIYKKRRREKCAKLSFLYFAKKKKQRILGTCDKHFIVPITYLSINSVRKLFIMFT